MASTLTTPADTLFTQMVAGLTDYPFNLLTTSVSQYLATVASGLTGGSYSHLRYSEEQLLALISSNLAGTAISALTSSVTDMLATIVNNPPAEGGGGEPGGPAVLIDFENGVYQSNGVDVARSSLLTEDSDNWYTFDTADIIPDVGYSVEGSEGPLLIGDCVTAMAAGSTVVFDITLGDNTATIALDLVKKWTYDPDIRLMMAAAIDDPTRVTDFTDAAVSSTPALGAGDHIIAATLSNGSVAISANGETDVTQSIAAWSTTPDGIGVSTGGTGSKIIRSIKIYAPPQSPLSALSA